MAEVLRGGAGVLCELFIGMLGGGICVDGVDGPAPFVGGVKVCSSSAVPPRFGLPAALRGRIGLLGVFSGVAVVSEVFCILAGVCGRGLSAGLFSSGVGGSAISSGERMCD